jgi:hypothetical protein
VFSEYQLSLPDYSQLGNKLFTRQKAVECVGLCYNAVKSHLRELEEEGILTSTRATAERGRGRDIFFSFTKGRAPPFRVRSPFDELPELDGIAPDCTVPVQSQIEEAQQL